MALSAMVTVDLKDEVYFGLGTPGTLEKPLPTAQTLNTHRVSVAR